MRKNYTGVETILSDVRDLTLPAASIDVVFINACYPNIADKAGAFANLSRMLKPDGRLVVSHPLGKKFVDILKKTAPFPLDDFPLEADAKDCLDPHGFEINMFVDQPELYILAAVKYR